MDVVEGMDGVDVEIDEVRLEEIQEHAARAAGIVGHTAEYLDGGVGGPEGVAYAVVGAEVKLGVDKHHHFFYLFSSFI